MTLPGRVPAVDLYCLCWNEAALLPHFFRHYDSLVRRFHVFDNRSTDGSLELLHDHGRVQVTSFDTIGDSFVECEQRLSDTMWKSARDEGVSAPDWILVIDMDEFLFHPDMHSYLQRCMQQGVTAIRTLGFEMVGDAFPNEDAPMYRTITRGLRSPGYDKPALFAPAAITETKFTIGRHGANPQGHVRWPDAAEVALLHFKHLGLQYCRDRNALLRTGLKRRDIAQGWGRHYLRSAQQVEADFHRLRAAAQPVPGLPGGPAFDTLGQEERMIRTAGRFRPDWYLATNPDVAAAGLDAAAHFHHQGWREGRLPYPGCNPAPVLAGIDLTDLTVRNPFFAAMTATLDMPSRRPGLS